MYLYIAKEHKQFLIYFTLCVRTEFPFLNMGYIRYIVVQKIIIFFRSYDLFYWAHFFFLMISRFFTVIFLN